MKKSLIIAIMSVLVLFAGANTAMAQDAAGFSATLSGANEVGDPGDADGSGTASVTIDVANTQVCFDVAVAEIGAATAGHIHSGAAGSNGDVVIDFKLDATNLKACVASDTALLTSIVESPALFYVNVHNEEFPGGAIRGQLAAAAAPAPAATAEPTATPEPAADDAAAATTTDADADATADTTQELAFTGDVTGYLAMAGAALVAAGASMVIAGRRR